jgi:hypothetical protein
LRTAQVVKRTVWMGRSGSRWARPTIDVSSATAGRAEDRKTRHVLWTYGSVCQSPTNATSPSADKLVGSCLVAQVRRPPRTVCKVLTCLHCLPILRLAGNCGSLQKRERHLVLSAHVCLIRLVRVGAGRTVYENAKRSQFLYRRTLSAAKAPINTP